MPKVRASSGTIGTRRGPSTLSRVSKVSARTNAIVVDISRPAPVPSSSGANADSAGTGGVLSARRRRDGSAPPSAARRARKYSASGESDGGT